MRSTVHMLAHFLILIAFGQMLSTCACCMQVARVHARILCAPVLRIHEIFLLIRILGFIPLTNGSGSADPYLWLMDPDPDEDPDPAIFVSDPRRQQKNAYYFFQRWKVIKKSQNNRYPGSNQCFSYYICLMVEGYGSWSVSLANGSGSGRPQNIWILRIQIRNTGTHAWIWPAHACAVLERMLCASANVTCSFIIDYGF